MRFTRSRPPRVLSSREPSFPLPVAPPCPEPGREGTRRLASETNQGRRRWSRRAEGTCADETAWLTAADWRTRETRTGSPPPDWLTAENPGEARGVETNQGRASRDPTPSPRPRPRRKTIDAGATPIPPRPPRLPRRRRFARARVTGRPPSGRASPTPSPIPTPSPTRGTPRADVPGARGEGRRRRRESSEDGRRRREPGRRTAPRRSRRRRRRREEERRVGGGGLVSPRGDGFSAPPTPARTTPPPLRARTRRKRPEDSRRRSRSRCARSRCARSRCARSRCARSRCARSRTLPLPSRGYSGVPGVYSGVPSSGVPSRRRLRGRPRRPRGGGERARRAVRLPGTHGVRARRRVRLRRDGAARETPPAVRRRRPTRANRRVHHHPTKHRA